MLSYLCTVDFDKSAPGQESYNILRCVDIAMRLAEQDLLEAVQLHNMPRVRELLTSGLSLDSAPQPLPPMTPPLIEAVCAGHRDLVEMLLERRANLLARDVALGNYLPL